MKKVAAIALVFAGGFATSAFGQYVDAGVWNRFVDWGQGEASVWQYGVVDSVASNEWYSAADVQPLSWSPGQTADQGSFNHGDRSVVNRSGMSVSADGAAPYIGWNNPAGNGTAVNIDGRVRVQTAAATGSVDSVEFVVAKRTADGSFVELHRARVNSADIRSMGEAGMVLPVSLGKVVVNEGESIVLSGRAMGEGDDPVTVQLIDDISIAIEPPEQTGKIMEAAFNRPLNHARPGGFGGGGGGGGGGAPGTGLPPSPTETVLDDGPSDDSSSMPSMIPSPSGAAVLAVLGGILAGRRRR